MSELRTSAGGSSHEHCTDYLFSPLFVYLRILLEEAMQTSLEMISERSGYAPLSRRGRIIFTRILEAERRNRIHETNSHNLNADRILRRTRNPTDSLRQLLLNWPMDTERRATTMAVRASLPL